MSSLISTADHVWKKALGKLNFLFHLTSSKCEQLMKQKLSGIMLGFARDS